MKNQKLKYLVDVQKGKLPKIFSKDNNFPVYLSMDYLRGNENDIRYVEDENVVFSEKDDILILWDGSNAGEILLSKEGVISSTTALLKPKQNLNKSYLFYQLKSSEQYFKDMSVGMGIPHVNPQELLNFSFFIPSFSEQTTIANYLDRKTAEIDQLIADKEKLVELYEEEKTAVINQAVTKGINPNVKMKESGIEWLGEIPEHWEVKRLRYLVKIGNGQNHKDVWDEDGEYPIYGSGGIFGKANKFIFNKPSVLLGRKGTIDKPQFVEIPFWTVDTAYYTIINENIVFPYFFFLLTKTINFEKYKYGSAVPSMTQEVLKEIRFAIPLLKEQQSIIHHIESETARIDEKIEDTQKLIELLKEYRTALISEVVTGKVKVTE